MKKQSFGTNFIANVIKFAVLIWAVYLGLLGIKYLWKLLF